MEVKLYVGNLPFDITENDLRDMLSQHGPVNEINVIMDKMTGRSKGFGFVEMATDEEAQAAIAMWDGKDFNGRTLRVNEARPLEDRPPRRTGGAGGGFNRGGGRGFGGGGGYGRNDQ